MVTDALKDIFIGLRFAGGGVAVLVYVFTHFGGKDCEAAVALTGPMIGFDFKFTTPDGIVFDRIGARVGIGDRVVAYTLGNFIEKGAWDSILLGEEAEGELISQPIDDGESDAIEDGCPLEPKFRLLGGDDAGVDLLGLSRTHFKCLAIVGEEYFGVGIDEGIEAVEDDNVGVEVEYAVEERGEKKSSDRSKADNFTNADRSCLAGECAKVSFVDREERNIRMEVIEGFAKLVGLLGGFLTEGNGKSADGLEFCFNRHLALPIYSVWVASLFRFRQEDNTIEKVLRDGREGASPVGGDGKLREFRQR